MDNIYTSLPQVSDRDLEALARELMQAYEVGMRERERRIAALLKPFER
jgi:hypothetical protein